MTLRPVNNPAAGVAQRTRTGRHFSGMTRRDLAFVHLHRPIKAAYLKATCPRRTGADPEKRIPATVASKMLDAGDALGGVGRITFQMTSVFFETVAMKRSIELLGTKVAPIVRAARSKPVIADRWTRRFVERSLNMHKNAFTPEETCWKID